MLVHCCPLVPVCLLALRFCCPEGASRGASLSERGREILEAARAFGAGSSAQEREALARQEATFHHLTTLAAFLRLASQGRPAEAIRVRANTANSQPAAVLSTAGV